MEYIARGKFVLTNHNRYGTDGILEDGAVYVSGQSIVEVAAYQDLTAAYPNATVIGSPEFWVMPGFVSAHQHGKGLTSYQLGGLDDCLELRVSAPPQAKVDNYLDTLYGCAQMIEAGVTCCIHYNSSRGPAHYEADVVERIRAYREAGLRVSFGLDIRNRNYLVYGDDNFFSSLPEHLREKAREEYAKPRTAAPDDYFRLAGRLSETIEKESRGRIKILLTPAGPQWCTEDLLRAIQRESEDKQLGVQMHVLETKYQRSYFSRAYGQSAVQWLDHLSFLGPQTSLAHGVWLSREDAVILAKKKTPLVHNPSSNLRLRSGIAPIPMLHEAGVSLALGLDSSTLNDEPDMLQEMRLCANLQRVPGVDAKLVPLKEIFRMGTLNGSQALGWGGFAGSLEPGKRADMVLLDAKSFSEPYVAPHQNPIDTLITRGKSNAVDTVIVDGEILYQGKKHLRLEPNQIVASLRKTVMPAAPATGDNLGDELLPYVVRFYQSWDKDQLSPFHQVNSTL
ncbi:MAG TPA: amidohydrolase family protein [Candidatus Binatia bacterium]|nr:amidohydrolase family protein [Candidatus Binatia bacterium]